MAKNKDNKKKMGNDEKAAKKNKKKMTPED